MFFDSPICGWGLGCMKFGKVFHLVGLINTLNIYFFFWVVAGPTILVISGGVYTRQISPISWFFRHIPISRRKQEWIQIPAIKIWAKDLDPVSIIPDSFSCRSENLSGIVETENGVCRYAPKSVSTNTGYRWM